MDQALSPFSVRRQASHVSCVRRQASHVSGVRRQASHVSCVRRQASGVRRQASGVPRLRRQASHVSRVRRQASGVRRPTSQASGVRRPGSFSRGRPIAGHDGNKRRHFPMLQPSDLRPLSRIAWGNRVVFPPPYSSTGAIVRIKTAGGALLKRRPLLLLNEKGRHYAGPVAQS